MPPCFLKKARLYITAYNLDAPGNSKYRRLPTAIRKYWEIDELISYTSKSKHR